jgi:biotin carboxyl carrier protein
MNISLLFAEKEFRLRLREREDNHIQVVLEGKTYDIDIEYFSDEEYLLKINGRVYDVIVSPNTDSYSVSIHGKNIHVGKKSPLQLLGGKGARSERREVKTSMPGRIIEVLVGEGDDVKEGQAVLILEAMKMQNEIKSPQPGKVACIGPGAGESVEAGTLLFIIE